MNRVNAPDAQIVDYLDSNMAAVDILDLIEKDPNDIASNPVPDANLGANIMSEVTGRDMEDRQDCALEENFDFDADIVGNWEETGATKIVDSSRASDSSLVDGAIVPIKHDIAYRGTTLKLYVEGTKILWGAKYLQFHDPDTSCMAYLDSAEDGILHVLPGWTQRELIDDIGYRYKAGRVTEVDVPFLGRIRCKKRTYDCEGVLVCPRSTPEFRCKSHFVVEDSNDDVKRIVELCEESELMKRNALHKFREVKSERQYCKARLWARNDVTTFCSGSPVVRESKKKRLYGSKYFLGCTGFRDAPNVQHTIRKLDALDEEGIRYLKGFLSGEIRPIDEDDDVECKYVHSKKRRCTSLCQVHKEPLVSVRCEEHRMSIFEPLPQDGVVVPKMVYASCFGAHSHPPPPPPDATLRKIKMLEEETEKDPSASVSVLRQRVEEKLVKQIERGIGGRAVRGTPHVPASTAGRKVSTAT